MLDDRETQAPTNLAIEPANANTPAALIAHIERALHGEMEPFLQRVKQMTLEIIEEIETRHAPSLMEHARKLLVETVTSVVKAEVSVLLDRLRPAMAEGSMALRETADSLMGELKGFINGTVIEVFQVHIPEYSRWVGQRVIDYVLAGTLFCLAAVLLCVGSILGLQEAGVPTFATFLIGGGAALAAGWAFLRWRSAK